MKPIAIFRHSPTEGPTYFATYLERRNLPFREIKIDAGEVVPADASSFAGLYFMGGPMSVNDDLPWIAPVCSLIRDAVECDVPVLNDPEARRWLGDDLHEFLTLHWHGETFAIPEGAARLMQSPWCANQAYALGKHFGMQCHVEMTPELILTWCRDWAKEVEAHAGRVPSVQTPAEMEADIEDKVRALNAVADRIYDRWISGFAS